MKWLAALLTFLFSLPALAQLPPQAQGYQLAFYDNFSRTNVDPSISTTYDGSTYYVSQDCCMSPWGFLWPSWPPGQNWGIPSPFSHLKPSGLAITLRKQAVSQMTCGTPDKQCWIGGQIASWSRDGYSGSNAGLFQYGYLQARIQLPAVNPNNPPNAIWPSVALYTPGGAPYKFEFDLFEANGGNNLPYSTMTAHDWQHAPTYTPMVVAGLPNPFDGQWHTYGLLWTPQEFITYIDGVKVGESVSTINGQQIGKMGWAITLGVGEGWTPNASEAPYTMNVDYVEFYQP